MRNGKSLKVIRWCLGIVVGLAVCGLFAADYTVDRVMESFASAPEAASSETVLQEMTAAPAPQETIEAAGQAGAHANGLKDESAQQSQVPSLPVSSAKPTGTVTKQQVNEVQEKLTAADKAQIISIMTKSLSMDILEKLWNLAKGGLTVEEKREAKEVLLSMLSSEDYNVLSALAKKYGISRGKTYEEAMQEVLK